MAAAKPKPTWDNLPDTFKKRVVMKLDLRSRNALKVCFQKDKKFVDECPLELQSLEIAFTNQKTVKFLSSTSNYKIVCNDTSRILKMLQTPYLSIQDFKIFSGESQFHQVTEFINQLSETTIQAKNLYWRCSPADSADDFIRFLECFDGLEMIHNDMNKFTCDQMNRMGEMTQWKNTKEIWLGNGELESVEQILDKRSSRVYFKKLEEEDVWKMIQSFISHDFPIGSSFDLLIENPPCLKKVYRSHGIAPKHQPIFPDDIGIKGRHTQRFQMPTEGHFLVVKNTETGIRGTIQDIL